MIIEKIKLENFLCYSGENLFEFSEGINVIIGDNGYGKSKLYDAFYWVMYNQVFITEQKRFASTKEVKSGLISDKAKAEISNGKISAIVTITFHNKENGRDYRYILERKYTANVKDGKLQDSNDSEFTVFHQELTYLKAKMIVDVEEKNKIIARILPPQIKDYLWFQGEQVESIIDFNKQDTLTKAINVLSSITRYDVMKSIAAAAAKSANTEFDKEVRRLSKDINKSETLENEKIRLERIVDNLLQEEEEINDNLSRADSKCEELLNKIPDATKVNELQQKKNGILNLLSELNNSLNEEQTSFHRKLFKNKWVLKGTEYLQIAYSEKFSDYEKKKLEATNERERKLALENEVEERLQTRLPFNVPEPNYVQWMLDKERCLVCDRDAKRDSQAWKKIRELIDRKDSKGVTKKHEPLTTHDFTDDLKRLYQTGLALAHRIGDIDGDINETLTKRNNIAFKIKQANSDLESVETEIQKLLSDTSLSLDTANHILDEYSVANKYSKDYKETQNKVLQQLEHNRSNLRNVNEQLTKLVTGEIPAWLIEKKEILSDFEEVARTTRDRVFTSLIEQLEAEANVHYEAMTSGNRSARGRIKLRKLPNGNYMPEIIDNNGNPLLGLNTSNLILVKLSAIMAIVSAKNSSGFVNLYTLITDAPTSVFGEDYTIGFCKTISKVYKQSIIMSKEFYKNENLRNELTSNPDIKIGRVYTITPSILEAERENRNTLSTKIETVN